MNDSDSKVSYHSVAYTKLDSSTLTAIEKSAWILNSNRTAYIGFSATIKSHAGGGYPIYYGDGESGA